MKYRLLLASMLAAAGNLGVLSQQSQRRAYTHADEERQVKAEAKRQRKAAKRAKAKGAAV